MFVVGHQVRDTFSTAKNLHFVPQAIHIGHRMSFDLAEISLDKLVLAVQQTNNVSPNENVIGQVMSDLPMDPKQYSDVGDATSNVLIESQCPDMPSV